MGPSRSSPDLRGARRSALAAALAAGLAAAGVAAGQAMPLPPPGAPPLRIGPGQQHTFTLDLAPGERVELLLDQLSADVELTVRDARGRAVARAAGRGAWKRERTAFLSGGGGRFRLEVTPVVGPHQAGTYRLAPWSAHPERPGDAERLAARALVDAAEAAVVETPAEEMGPVLELVAAARDAARWAGDPESEARALDLEGEALIAAGRGPEAFAAFAAAVATAEGEHPSVAAMAEESLARQLASGDAPEEAGGHYERAVELARRGDDQTILGFVLHNAGAFEANRGRPGEALPLLREALAIRQRLGNEADELSTLLALGPVHRRRNDLEAALACYERASLLDDRMPNPRKDLRVLLLVNNGSLLRSAGRHDEALAAFTRGLDLIREGEITGRLEEMELLFALHLGALHSELGETGRAAAWLEEALALARRYDLGRSQAAALLQLGWVELLEARPEEAAEHFRAGLGVAGLGAETRSYLLQGLGTAYVEAGRPEAAVDVLTEAVAVAREAGATAAESEAVRRLAAAYLAGGRLEEAGAALEGALGRREEIAMPLVRGAVHSLYAQLERRRGNRRPALHHVLQALEMRESVRSSIASPALRASFLARWRDDYDLAVDLLMGLDAEEPGRGYAERAFEISEASHARTLTELLTEARIEVRRGIAPDLLARERRVAARLSLVQQELTARLSGDSPGAEEIARVRRAWEDLKREREAIEVEIRRQHPRYAAIRYPRPPAARDVRAALPPRTALVEFSLGAERSYLFVLTREGLSTFPLPPATNLAESVRAIRWTVGQRSPLTAPRLVAEGRRLYGQLLAPAEEVLRGVDHIDVVPDRDLFYLPFELLVTGGDGEGPPAWLVRRWSVAYAPSAAVFLSLGRPPAGDGWQGDLVGFADPATAVVDPPPEVARGLPTELAPGPALGPLPGARSELEGLAALFPADRTRVYLGGEALESALKQPGATSGMRRLHIASHGVIADENPADSFLLFTADPAAGDDGRLRVHEVFDLELGSETVVLSGCETGLGERVLGEGLVGMTRAFLYAGARQVVVSLWPVGDDSARDLMLDLYRGLRAGMGTADALRAAKLRRLGEDPAAKPFAWAPFILVGAADSM